MARVLTHGETMLRVSPQDAGRRLADAGIFRVEPGGSESNVAIALAALGHSCRHMTRVPSNPLGDLVVGELARCGLDSSLVARGGERLGCYWTELGGGPRPSRVVYDRADSSLALWEPSPEEWRSALAGVEWLHVSGITPALSPQAARALQAGLAAAAESGVPVSLDLNFRSQLWRYMEESERAERVAAVMGELCRRCHLIMGNETDWRDVFGLAPGPETDPAAAYAAVAREAMARFPRLQTLAISLRRSISASENGFGGLLFQRSPEGFEVWPGEEILIRPVVDRVGAGDAFAAGVVHGVLSGWEGGRTVNFAVALGALKHTLRGDPCRFSEAEVLQVMASGLSGRILR